MSDLKNSDRSTDAGAKAPRAGLWHRLYHGETTYDFVGKRNIGFAISGLLILITLISLSTRGLNLGLDFKGGVVWEPPAKNGLTVDDARSVLDANGIKTDDAKFQKLSGASGSRIRIQTGVETVEVQTKIRQALAEKAGVTLDDVPLSSVSSTWGGEITRKAVKALLVFFAALTVYIWIRFKGWRMALSAFLAVAHDVLLSVGVYSVLGLPVTPATVIAFLTILGFSLYDTIVVFDKVRENERKMSSGLTYTDVVNVSMNQTLMRSINTSLAAVLPVLSLLVVGAGILGAVALKEFALALFIGLLAGSYSSIFIASPALALLERVGKKGRDRRRRESGGLSKRSDVAVATALASGKSLTVSELSDRAESMSGSSMSGTSMSGTSMSSSSLSGADPSGVSSQSDRPSAMSGAPMGLTHAPRPRKKKRR
jgi:preprotein translocase subunit SecF